jgi:hypothetical protein
LFFVDFCLEPLFPFSLILVFIFLILHTAGIQTFCYSLTTSLVQATILKHQVENRVGARGVSKPIHEGMIIIYERRSGNQIQAEEERSRAVEYLSAIMVRQLFQKPIYLKAHLRCVMRVPTRYCNDNAAKLLPQDVFLLL